VDYGAYEEKALSAEERRSGKVLLCQAQALSDVTIEAHELVTPVTHTIRIEPVK
jgi:hypothetical protein